MFSTSTAKRVAREAEKIVSLKEDMDAVSWTRVLEIGNQLQEGVEEAERIALARRHARLLSAREGRNIVRMRKHAMWYLAGLPGAAAARGRINGCVSVEDFDEVFDELLACAREHAAAHE